MKTGTAARISIGFERMLNLNRLKTDKQQKISIPVQQHIQKQSVFISHEQPWCKEAVLFRWTSFGTHCARRQSGELQLCALVVLYWGEGMGIAQDRPTAMDFKYRLEWYILGKRAQLILQNSNQTQVWSSHPSTSANSGVKTFRKF